MRALALLATVLVFPHSSLFATDSQSPKYKSTTLYATAETQFIAIAPPPRRYSTSFRVPAKPLPPPTKAKARETRRAAPPAAPAPAKPRWNPWAWTAAALAILGVAYGVRRQRAAARQHSDAMALLAHELKSPLSALESYLDLMVHESAGAGPRDVARWNEDAKRLKINARQLQETISDMLQAARLQSGALHPQMLPVDLAAIVRELIAFYRPLAEKSRVELSLVAQGRGHASGDAALIRRVLHNLISNAIKFTPEGGQVRITMGPDPQSSQLLCTVSDTGVGLGNGEIERLFKKFVRLRKGLHGEDGSGLGLYIAKAIVEAHGGRIWAESAPHRGSRFHFTLPIKEHA